MGPFESTIVPGRIVPTCKTHEEPVVSSVHYWTDAPEGGHRTVRTTMIAMLPPTSPTTVIGGFSLAIITGKTKRMTRPQSVTHH